MLDPQHIQPDEAAGRMAAAFRKVAVPAGPPSAVVAKVLARDFPKQVARKDRFIMVKRMTRIAAVLALGLLVAGSAWLWFGHGATVTFADVVQQLLTVRTATFNLTVKIPGQPPQPCQVMYRVPNRMRMRMPAQGMVMISDLQNGTMTTLLPDQKKAIVVNVTQVSADRLEQADKGLFDQLRDYFQDALAGGSAKVQSLGEKQIEGRLAVGFRVQDAGQDIEAWVDPQTALPVYIEGSTRAMAGTSVWEQFAFNMELDESLFDATPPADYTVQNMSVNASDPAEADLIAGLRVFTEYADGAFPVELVLGPKTQEQMKAALQARVRQLEQEQNSQTRDQAMVKLGAMFLPVQRAFMFAQMLPKDSDWHYAGAGVKLNTPDTPIFWYRPADATAYRVIYADLSVRDVPPSQIPTTAPHTTAPSTQPAP